MADTNTGGAAFPNQKLRTNGDDGCGMYAFDQGMTLRDYFAAQSLGLILSNPERLETVNSIKTLGPQKSIARMAYSLADAMLEARKA